MSKPVNIVYYHDALIPRHSISVFEVLIGRLIRTAPVGAKVTILCQSFNCDPKLQRNNSATDFIFINTSSKSKLRTVIARQLLRIFSSKHDEVTVIVNMMNIYTVWIWSILARMCGCYSICRFTGLTPTKKRDFIKQLSRNTLIFLSVHLCHHTISVSKNLGAFIKNIAPSREVSVVNQGVAGIFLTTKINDKILMSVTDYVFIGRLVKNKGIIQLVEAFLQLSGRCRSLKIIGHGPLYEKVKIMTEGHTNIILCGPRSQAEIVQTLISSSTLILPSDHEGTPNVLLEAMATHTFVLASDVGESRTLIGSDRGLLLRSNSVGDIKEGILASEVIAHRQEILKRAHDLVFNEYNETMTQNRMNNLIETFLNRDDR
ncbi:glycosyltransferase family 4 protein [Alphaproteobacteria bacterium]|nr:glycosyltransferase family 4 protein [Alphaproteobacteria bacterium]